LRSTRETPRAAPRSTASRSTATGTATLRGVGDDLTWAFNATPDKPPTIALTKDPEQQNRGAMLLSYRVEDDYGATEAHATFARKDEPAAKGDGPHPLYGPPDFSLVLPQALVEQRRNLALDARVRSQVITAVDALTLGPDKFRTEAGIYLGLRSIFWSLVRAKSDDDLRESSGAANKRNRQALAYVYSRAGAARGGQAPHPRRGRGERAPRVPGARAAPRHRVHLLADASFSWPLNMKRRC
jgi:Domain of unknown function (DUF4175)